MWVFVCGRGCGCGILRQRQPLVGDVCVGVEGGGDDGWQPVTHLSERNNFSPSIFFNTLTRCSFFVIRFSNDFSIITIPDLHFVFRLSTRVISSSSNRLCVSCIWMWYLTAPRFSSYTVARGRPSMTDMTWAPRRRCMCMRYRDHVPGWVCF